MSSPIPGSTSGPNGGGTRWCHSASDPRGPSRGGGPSRGRLPHQLRGPSCTIVPRASCPLGTPCPDYTPCPAGACCPDCARNQTCTAYYCPSLEIWCRMRYYVDGSFGLIWFEYFDIKVSYLFSLENSL